MKFRKVSKFNLPDGGVLAVSQHNADRAEQITMTFGVLDKAEDGTVRCVYAGGEIGNVKHYLPIEELVKFYNENKPD